MAYSSKRKDLLITTISRLGSRRAVNPLETFMNEYGLCNLATATEEQLQAFLDEYMRKYGGMKRQQD